MSRVKNHCADCGAAVKRADLSHCADCGKPLCPAHTLQYVDGNNAAITRHSPRYCRACYGKHYRD